ncbi:MAG: hypothetical protein HY960_11935 [Ignavibacteriae bacterium]|nr:hypothetical protein [Ignavibacteriota bacterium]
MPYSNISAELPDADRDAAIDALKSARAKLPFLINLTAEERGTMLKMGDKSVSFVSKSLDYCKANPNLSPPYLDATELQKDVVLTQQLSPIMQELASLFEAVSDTYMAVGSEAFTSALVFYNSVKAASKSNVTGITSIYDDLKTRFPGRPPKSGPTP